MEHMHLVVNLSNDNSTISSTPIPNTNIILKINKALLISRRQNMFFNEEFYKYAIEIKVGNEYWVIFRRYSEIREEHERMIKKFSALKQEFFPPRSPFNKTDTFQIDRQQKLEQYLKSLISTALNDDLFNYTNTRRVSETAKVLNKETFCEYLTFFTESVEDKLNVQKLGWKTAEW